MHVVHIGVREREMDLSFRDCDADAAIMLLLTAGSSLHSRYHGVDVDLFHVKSLKTIPCYHFSADTDVVGANRECVQAVRDLLGIVDAALD